MIGKTNVNGTNDASGVGAVLSIDAPTRSTVTVSSGSFSKVLRNSIEINTYFSRYFYLVTPSKFGSWTITATNGTDTASDDVVITINKEYEIKLSYALTLFDRTKDSFNFISSGFQTNASLFISDYSDSYVRFAAGGEYNLRGSWATPFPNDILRFSTLDICVYGSTDSRNKVGVTNTIVTDSSGDTWIAQSPIPANEGSVVQIPVSSSMAGKYFSVRLNGGKVFYIQYARLV